ncbi:hypothetical protein Cgig2_009199 [Carnegiea gigantea]|uniref:Uncharacterized protein n=1 Tax=Carnegiea gigantea TaxID=171969 RepID=A0A9Q1GRF6_9CARY|nr:hypothetical protein Cgig2_009199 [Carnegiea gigantea]
MNDIKEGQFFIEGEAVEVRTINIDSVLKDSENINNCEDDSDYDDATLRPINANEKERCITIENNARKLEELGLSKLADQSRMKTPNEIKGKEKLNRNDEDEDYIPAGDCEDDEFNHPIGPTDDDVSKFSKLLGIMAHDHTWAPLTYTNWTKLPHK